MKIREQGREDHLTKTKLLVGVFLFFLIFLEQQMKKKTFKRKLMILKRTSFQK